MTFVNRTVATSAQPIGRPGWPELAFSTASMARERRALAISSAVLEFVMKSARFLRFSRLFEAVLGLTGSVCLSMTALYSGAQRNRVICGRTYDRHRGYLRGRVRAARPGVPAPRGERPQPQRPHAYPRADRGRHAKA